jgi:hypothetical protein
MSRKSNQEALTIAETDRIGDQRRETTNAAIRTMVKGAWKSTSMVKNGKDTAVKR